MEVIIRFVHCLGCILSQWFTRSFGGARQYRCIFYTHSARLFSNNV